MKVITYKIESKIISNKFNISDNSDSGNKIINELNSENNSKIKHNNNKNYIKLCLTLQPNTIEETKLLTITMIDYSETLNEEQLKEIIETMFNNFDEIINKTVPLTKNCESIIVNANINIVYDFLTTWKIANIGDGLMTELKANGDPQVVGTKINYNYFNYPVFALVEEVNIYFQEGDEDDNNEWNYKYKMFFKDNECEIVNCIFVSCENGSKTWVSVENDINEKIGIEKLQELSKRKLMVLNNMKNYIEKNKNQLIDLYTKNKKN